jgi:hypothetical protein
MDMTSILIFFFFLFFFSFSFSSFLGKRIDLKVRLAWRVLCVVWTSDDSSFLTWDSGPVC